MWGQSWGDMVWGAAAAVPSIGGAGAILLIGILFGVGAARSKRSTR